MPPPGYQSPQLRRQSTSPQLVRRAFVVPPIPPHGSKKAAANAANANAADDAAQIAEVAALPRPKAVRAAKKAQPTQPPPRVRRARLVPDPPRERELTADITEVPDEEDADDAAAASEHTLLLPRLNAGGGSFAAVTELKTYGAGSDGSADSDDGSKSSNYSLFGLLVLGFFWVSGGCFGNEELLSAGPPIVILPSLLIAPLVFSLPLALIVTELTAMMPFDGGLVSWVQHVYGPKVAGHNSYALAVSYLVDTAIYPLLAGHYINNRLHNSNSFVETVGRDQVAPIIAIGVIILVSGVKLLGNDLLVKFNAVLIVASLLPIIIFIGWTMPEWSPSDWALKEGKVELSLLVAWQIWLYSGFASLGSLASEVDNPGPTMIKVILILMPVVILINCLPLVAALSYDKDYQNYAVGTFSEVASKVGGSWLGIWVAVGAQMVMIGLYNGGSMVTERSLAQLTTSRFPVLTLSGSERKSKMWQWAVNDETYGVGPLFILGNMVLTCILVWLPYTLLVEIGVMVTTIPAVLQVFCFVHLRIKRPDMVRPYKVPGGYVGMTIASVLVLVFTLAYFVISVMDTSPAVIVGREYYYLKPISFTIITGIGFLVHIAWRLARGDRSEQEMEDHNIEAAKLLPTLEDVERYKNRNAEASEA